MSTRRPVGHVPLNPINGQKTSAPQSLGFFCSAPQTVAVFANICWHHNLFTSITAHGGLLSALYSCRPVAPMALSSRNPIAPDRAQFCTNKQNRISYVLCVCVCVLVRRPEASWEKVWPPYGRMRYSQLCGSASLDSRKLIAETGTRNKGGISFERTKHPKWIVWT